MTPPLRPAPSSEQTFKRLFDQLYPELRIIARRRLRNESRIQTLDSIALVSETYLRLYRRYAAEVMSEAAFKALCAQVMGNVLIDHYRAHKGRYGSPSVSAESEAKEDTRIEAFEALHPLEHLERVDPVMSWVARCRLWGMPHAEIARASEETPSVPTLTVKQVEKLWAEAKRLFRSWLGEQPDEPDTF